MRRLPPLNQVRAFEAAGRLGSFKRAAYELSVSDSAISQHVRSLEDFLGAPLFTRSHAGVALTSAGAALLPQISAALDQIAVAAETFEADGLIGELRVSVAPSLGSRWLVPRLARFSKAHPGIAVTPIMTPSLADLARGEADLGIRHGGGDWSDVDAVFLRDAMLAPVGAPALLGERRLGSAAELLRYPLLSAQPRPKEWSHWFNNAGSALPPAQSFIVYDTVALAIDAAIAGLGVALVDPMIVADDMRFGRLRRAFDHSSPALSAYYVVTPKSPTPNAKAVAFRDWVVREFSEEAARGAP